MDAGLMQLVLACLAFVGTHIVLSNPLRRPALRMLGERGFLGFYSLVSLVTLSWTAFAYGRAERGTPAWNGMAAAPWIAASLMTYVALVLVLASLRGNPAAVGANLAGLSARRPWGVYLITRHPMMMGTALWALAHILVMPTQRSAVLGTALIGLALGGAALQDRRKRADSGREWAAWMSKTAFWPDVTRAGALGAAAWLVGLLLWLGLTAAHLFFKVPAGIWAFVR